MGISRTAKYVSHKQLAIIHLVRTQKFSEKKHSLPHDTQTNVRISRGKKC